MEKRSVTALSGLHHTQAIRFVQKANEFQSEIWVEYNNIRLNAKSLLGILYLGVTAGAAPTLMAEGPDADQALSSLALLL